MIKTGLKITLWVLFIALQTDQSVSAQTEAPPSSSSVSVPVASALTADDYLKIIKEIVDRKDIRDISLIKKIFNTELSVTPETSREAPYNKSDISYNSIITSLKIEGISSRIPFSYEIMMAGSEDRSASFRGFIGNITFSIKDVCLSIKKVSQTLNITINDMRPTFPFIPALIGFKSDPIDNHGLFLYFVGNYDKTDSCIKTVGFTETNPSYRVEN